MIDLPADHLDIVRGILRSYLPNREIWVFGSRANGAAKKYSDLDLAIVGEPLPLELESRLADAFEESDLPIKVDIVDLNKVSPEFGALIRAKRQIL